MFVDHMWDEAVRGLDSRSARVRMRAVGGQAPSSPRRGKRMIVRYQRRPRVGRRRPDCHRLTVDTGVGAEGRRSTMSSSRSRSRTCSAAASRSCSAAASRSSARRASSAAATFPVGGEVVIWWGNGDDDAVRLAPLASPACGRSPTPRLPSTSTTTDCLSSRSSSGRRKTAHCPATSSGPPLASVGAS